MAFMKPPEIAEAAIGSGVQRASLSTSKLIVAGILAGAFIALGGLFGVAVTAGLNPAVWGTLPQLFTGAAFSFGLMLVVITGAELVTGGIAFTGIAALKGEVSWARWASYAAITLFGAIIGALAVAYFLGVQSGILTIDPALTRISDIGTLKAGESDWALFLRGIGCNWLVCLAIWGAIAADDISGKVLAIFFPITAFVAMGFDHVVANMFFLPAANFAGAPVEWADILRNWLFAGAGNLVGAMVFVAGAYYFLFLRETESEPEPAAEKSPTPVSARTEATGAA